LALEIFVPFFELANELFEHRKADLMLPPGFEPRVFPLGVVIPGVRGVRLHHLSGRPKGGDPRAGYCIITLDGRGVHAEQVRVPYNVELACHRLQDAGLSPYFAAYLRTGGAVPETAPERALVDHVVKRQPV